MPETPHMPELTFRQIPLPVLKHGEQLWVKATDLARALEYSREDKVTRIYERHADEFTPKMTQVIEIGTEPQFGTGRMRIFSLRGCHLIAMLARTPVAKEFRHWVLNILDAASHPEFKWSLWAKAFASNDSIRRLYFDAGRAQGQLDRFTPERQKLILKVCTMLDYGYLSQRAIAKKLRISKYVVGNIARRYHDGALSIGKRNILEHVIATLGDDTLE